ncbi:hypothetical protein [Pandoraea sputorum]|uniref:hypothetical protein n=1 Tax=Pandoraea sputorum TaxID=93222 RepID=UPI001240EDC3|nr:hypothetical protein [Pandoraea sputorum]
MKTLFITIYYIIAFSITTTLIFIMCTSMVDIYFFTTKGIYIFDISIIKKSTKAGIIAGITLGIGVRVLEIFKNREIHKTDID